MKNKKKIFYIILIIFLVIIGCIYIFKKKKKIGGERDKYGCLGVAGYTFDEDINACIRKWEVNENQREAAKMAVDKIGSEKGLTVNEVNVARCPGCFVVEFVKIDYQRIDVTLENWEVIKVEESMTPEECIEKGGRIVNIVGGENCNENEENIGNVYGFISPNICCL